MSPYRQTSAAEVLEAPVREGRARLELAPRHLVLEIPGGARVAVTDRFMTLSRGDSRRKSKKPQSIDMEKVRVILARAVPTDGVALWCESRPGVMQRLLGLTPVGYADPTAIDAWRALDRLYQHLFAAVDGHDKGSARAAEFGRGADRVLVEDKGDRDVVYVRPMFRERARVAMEVRDNGTVIFPTKTGEEIVEVQSRFSVTTHGDNINFAGPAGTTRAHIWLPWIAEQDRVVLARRFGERLDQSVRLAAAGR